MTINSNIFELDFNSRLIKLKLEPNFEQDQLESNFDSCLIKHKLESNVRPTHT